MPYIKQENREYLDGYGDPLDAGELNYVLTTIVHQYWEDNGQNYQAFNDILGALEGCKLEIYRRKIAPYEDQKILENGDV
jgi:hypothetical protein